MGLDAARLPLRLPFSPAIGKIPNIFLLFGIDRDHRLVAFLNPFDLPSNEVKLGIPVGMLLAFCRFAVRL